MADFKDLQFEVNEACKGEVSRSGLGFKVSYPQERFEELSQQDITALHAKNFEPVVKGTKVKYVFVPLYLSKYPG